MVLCPKDHERGTFTSDGGLLSTALPPLHHHKVLDIYHFIYLFIWGGILEGHLCLYIKYQRNLEKIVKDTYLIQ